jgi:hypothetical protein
VAAGKSSNRPSHPSYVVLSHLEPRVTATVSTQRVGPGRAGRAGGNRVRTVWVEARELPSLGAAIILAADQLGAIRERSGVGGLWGEESPMEADEPLLEVAGQKEV